MVDCLIHPLDSLFGCTDEILISDYLVHELLLRQMIHLALNIVCIVLPPVEPSGEWVVKIIQDHPCGLPCKPSLINKVLPRVESFRDHIELRIFEEHSHDTSLHVALLAENFFLNISVNLLRGVTCFNEVATQCIDISLDLILPQDNVTFGLINKFDEKILTFTSSASLRQSFL